jgi:hypothetical protein
MDNETAGWKANIPEIRVALTLATERVARAGQNETEPAFRSFSAGYFLQLTYTSRPTSPAHRSR